MSYQADIDTVLNSDMSFGEVVKSTINIVSKVTSTVGYRNVIDVIYNPDNPNEFWYDDTVFDNM